MKKIIGILMLSVVPLSVMGVTVFISGWVTALIIWTALATVFSLGFFGMKFFCEG